MTGMNSRVTDQASARARAYLHDLPKLHIWRGVPQVGGLNPYVGGRIVDAVSELGGAPRVLETGAGASTLLFLILDSPSVTTIAPDGALHERVLEAASERGINTGPLRFLVERSEVALPRLAAAGETIDLAFIDGNHGWPSVFVDFCYINVMLRKDGVLIVDDLQLHSVAQLFLLLRQQPGYELLSIEDKQATFRKVTDAKWLPDWREQPFIEMSSVSK
jgi:predicted O-methyltransferase YrrM